MSAAAPVAPPSREIEAEPIVERCAWCEGVPISCLACVECLEMFCSDICHLEFIVQEEERRRARNAAIAGVQTSAE